jgi:hypothetical protein
VAVNFEWLSSRYSSLYAKITATATYKASKQAYNAVKRQRDTEVAEQAVDGKLQPNKITGSLASVVASMTGSTASAPPTHFGDLKFVTPSILTFLIVLLFALFSLFAGATSSVNRNNGDDSDADAGDSSAQHVGRMRVMALTPAAAAGFSSPDASAATALPKPKMSLQEMLAFPKRYMK